MPEYLFALGCFISRGQNVATNGQQPLEPVERHLIIYVVSHRAERFRWRELVPTQRAEAASLPNEHSTTGTAIIIAGGPAG